ncbi:I78 family peptidase inhibitor [Pseudoroseicyclus sp. CXY001]|uniref:I78 family peptidase inhibitor n=1 Tax=Pseudoroseicyclus sp. CXY001 TaxID=3242492 RepID=UPI003570CD95
MKGLAMLRLSFAAPLLALSLAACTPPPQDVPPAEDLEACGAVESQALLGATKAEAEAALAARVADGTARILEPDAIITEEFMAGRLNVLLDEAGVVTRVSCG